MGDACALTYQSTRSRRRRDNRRRRQERAWEQRSRKEPDRHRLDCNCAACLNDTLGPPCWNCGVGRRPPPPRNRWPGPPAPPPGPYPPGYQPRPPPPRGHPRGPPRVIDVAEIENQASENRMSEEDLRTWSLAYNLSIDV